MENFLIVGLRNPGKRYELTRHNVGEMLLKAFATKQGISFKRSSFDGEIATISHQDKQLICLLPSTYMNLSGISVRKCIHYYKIHPSNLLIVVDDVEIPFGEIRIREQGASGGHNGLKNIIDQLGTKQFARLRIGVGKNPNLNLADYVLAKFSAQEQQELVGIMDNGYQVIMKWLEEGTQMASQLAGQLNRNYKLKGANINDADQKTSL